MGWRIDTRVRSALVLLLLGSCSGQQAEPGADGIPDIPARQQRQVTRSEFRYDWPFTAGTGAVGCIDGAVVFRTSGVSYALNDAARRRGLAPVDSVRQVQGSGPPSNPLGRMKQDERMRIFAALAACTSGPDAAACKHRVRITSALADAELSQIEAEGKERRWPPLPSTYMSLEPLVQSGLKLCQG